MQRPDPFFAVGNPKSGTTFLQRMLNMHPEVSCPSEQQLELIRKGLGHFFDQYQKVIDRTDTFTGGQGAPQIRLGLRSRVFRDVVVRLSTDFAGGKPIHGLNDNGAFTDLPRYDQQFGGPLIVLLFRNPVDIALSNWRHNHRLARDDPEHAKAHLSMLQNPRGSLEGYVERIVSMHTSDVSRIVDYISGRDNFLPVRYEALAADKAPQLTRIFGFLGAAVDDSIIGAIVAGSSKEAMAKTSKTPAFFGVGARAEPPVALAEDFRREMRDRWMTPQAEALGYRRDE